MFLRLGIYLLGLFAAALAADPLPLAELPPGETFLVIHPHHDDHTWQYGFGGLIAKMVDAGWSGVYVRVSNDEKDGANGWARNDMTNEAETHEALEALGVERVISLNWRNDHMDSIPLVELRAQLILLIRQLRPDAVMAYNPWGRYDRNPDHRIVARAVGEAVQLSSFANVQTEHGDVGLEPHHVPWVYYSQRSDYGKGYEPNVAVEISASQLARKKRAYWLHRNARVRPRSAANIRRALDDRGLRIPELEGLDDEQAAIQLQEWFMVWISAKRGEENGVPYAEVFFFADEWRAWPGLAGYLNESAVAQ